MTTYRKTMAEALKDVYLGENNLEKMLKAAGGSKQTLKMKDGSIGMDSFTASAIMKVYDKLNAKNKQTMEKLFKNGKKADILKLQKFAMSKISSEYVPEGFEEEFELDEAKASGGYDLYHNDFSSAMQHAYKMAKKLYGITIDPKEIDDKVATGPKKPGQYRQNKYRLKGDKGAIQVQVYNKGGSKPFELNMYKEEVELDEGYEGEVVKVLKKAKIASYFSNGILYVERGDGKDAMAALKKAPNIKELPKVREEEVELDEGKMSQIDKMMKDGKSAEEIAKALKLKVKEVKKIMGEDAELVGVAKKLKKASQAHAGQADTIMKHVKDMQKESAAADARRAMRRDPEMRQKGFSKDVSATDDDEKAASKNIMMQMRKAQSLKGRFDVEFQDGKKVKIPAKVAVAVQQKYNAMRRPAEKEKFQSKVAKSYKDMLRALKEGFASDAQRRAAFASGYKEKGKKKKESVLDRIDNKLKERKNG